MTPGLERRIVHEVSIPWNFTDEDDGEQPRTFPPPMSCNKRKPASFYSESLEHLSKKSLPSLDDQLGPFCSLGTFLPALFLEHNATSYKEKAEQDCGLHQDKNLQSR